MKCDNDSFISNIFNTNTITEDGNIVFPRVYAELYPATSFVEDARPDYYIKREQFESILKELYGTTGKYIYRSYVSGKCLGIVLIEEFKVMFFVTIVIKEDMIDRKYRLSNKDLDFVEELGGIDDLRDMLDETSASTYNSLALAPTIKDAELSDLIVRCFYYPSSECERSATFCSKYDEIKFDKECNKIATDNSIYTLGQNSFGLVLHKHYLDTSKYKLDIIDSNYNDNFVEAYANILKFLKTDSNGLILLTGEPGTGKSSFLMHLTSVCKDLNSRFVFIPASYAFILSDPSFLPFAVSNLNNSVLVLEDAEEILKDRAAGGSGAVSNILNITDGILGKLVKVKLIATVNKTHIIDSAVVRKGRLKLSYTFEKLSVDKANNLYVKLGKEIITEIPTTLADIYNTDINVIPTVITSKKKVGF